MIKLILKSKEYIIPSNFCYFNDVNTDIYKILTTKQQYEVQSNVSEEVFQSFLDNWMTKKLPQIDDDNINEYVELSEEFNLMSDLIQMYKQLSSKISNLEKQLEKAKIELDQDKKNHHQMANVLFNNTNPDIDKAFLNEYTCAKEAFENKDIEYISLLNNEKVEKNGILYVLDKFDHTSGVIGYMSEEGEDVFIPRSIQHQFIEYIVTVVHKMAFRGLKSSIQFAEDSEIEIFEDDSFFASDIREIKIPKSVIKIRKRAFNRCGFENITFSENSQLEIIDEKAFYDCFLKCISIPPSVKQIGDFAFYNEFEKIEFSNDSKLEKIGKFAFKSSNIDSFVIPPNVCQIGEGSFVSTKLLKNIQVMEGNRHFLSIENNNFVVGKSDQKSDNFDVIVFVNRDIEEARIPDNITRIESYSFNLCEKLQKVTFSENSQLDTICEYSFYESGIKAIQIPPKVTKIDQKCFLEAKHLVNVEVMKGNCHFLSIENNNFVVGKSDQKSDNFDVIVFVNRDIEEAKIPDNITRIESYSFNLCEKLQKVTFSENSQLDTICEYSFYESGIKTIQIPSKVTKISEYSFANCSNIKEVTFALNSELQTIGKYAFLKSSLESIKIPPSVTSIGEHCFNDCSKLVEVLIPENSRLKTIEQYAFSETPIESITITKRVKIIKECAFYNCKNLKKVEFADDSLLEIIEGEAFSGCSFEKVTIPVHVKKIGGGCFQANRNLKQVLFPPNSELEILGGSNFVDTKVESITIPPKVKKLKGLGGYVKRVYFAENSELETIIDFCFCYSGLEIIGPIPSSVTKIGSKCFHCCQDLKTIEFSPNSQLHTIGKNAFDTCGITSIVIPPHVTKIKKGTFSSCENLESVTFEEGSELRSIGKDAFSDSSIVHLQIPSSVTNLQNGCFNGTQELVDIQISPENKVFSMLNKQLILKKLGENGTFSSISFAIRNIESITIPSFIKVIGSNAFASCLNLQTVEFEKDSNLEIISEFSFSKSGIKYIKIPASVTHIADNAFIDCNNLQKIEFENNSKLVSIGNDAISRNPIESLSIPSSIEEFGLGWCFYASDLKYITIIPNGKQNICYYDDQFILGKTNLNQPNFNTIVFVRHDVQKVKIPNFIEEIEPFAFNSCFELYSIEFEKNSKLKIIGNCAFCNSSEFEEIEIPPSVEIIDRFAFLNCSELKYIAFSHDSNLKEIRKSSLPNDSLTSLYIPPHTTEIYLCNIQIVEIDEKTDLTHISLDALQNVQCLMVPSKLKVCKN